MTPDRLIKLIEDGFLDRKLAGIYGTDATEAQRARYISLLGEFMKRYGDGRDVALFSVPGRSELSGNHTDHNHGKILAAAVSIDIIAVAAPSRGSLIRVKSKGFPEDTVDISEYTGPDSSKFGTSAALIAGIVRGFRDNGFRAGGFDAVTASDVLGGSGLSSSAAFEDMIGTIISCFFNEESADPVTVAKISQYAENVFFGKPCGLMDQLACASGGIISVDFLDPKNPGIEKVDFDLTAAGYSLCIINTGGNHADLTPDYAAVPAEMKAVAGAFDEEVLRDLPEKEFMSSLRELRAKCGDRAILRAMHFYDENRRVAAQADALKSGDLASFLRFVRESGNSSFRWLQNVYTPNNVSEQGLSLALCLCEKYFANTGIEAACRVHGGGFAGTVQVFLPTGEAPGFTAFMSEVFGEGSCHILKVRRAGAVRVF